MGLKADITAAMKAAMKAGDKRRLGTIRLMTAAIKRVEVDERRELDDSDVLEILKKEIKQRKQSIAEYRKAEREDLAEQEEFEISVLEIWLPEQLSEAQIEEAVAAAIESTGATGPQDMGKLMGVLKGQLGDAADMGTVSKILKAKLAG